MEIVVKETTGKRPVPQKHGGAIWQGCPPGGPYCPIPGPGRKSNKQKEAERSGLQALNDATERKLKARANQVAEQAFDAWAKHNPALLDKLLDRRYGKVEQLVKVEIPNEALLLYAIRTVAELYGTARIEEFASKLKQLAEPAVATALRDGTWVAEDSGVATDPDQ